MAQNITDVIFNVQLFEQSLDPIIKGYEKVLEVQKKVELQPLLVLKNMAQPLILGC